MNGQQFDIWKQQPPIPPTTATTTPTTTTPRTTTSSTSTTSTERNSQPRSFILVYKTLNSVFKSSRKIIVRVCEVAIAKKVKSYKMFNLYSSLNKRNTNDDKDQAKELETTGHDRFYQRPSRYKNIYIRTIYIMYIYMILNIMIIVRKKCMDWMINICIYIYIIHVCMRVE